MRTTPIVLMTVLLTGFLAARADCAPYRAVAVPNGATITGQVSYAGAPPKPKRVAVTKDKDVCAAQPHFDNSLKVASDGGIANAVVFISNIAQGAPAKPRVVTMDQKGCQYIPRVLAFPAGSTVDVLNSDGILHNIHTYSSLNSPVNYAQPGFKKELQITVDHPELIKVTCDAHDWMEGWWYVFGNPYFARTGADGRFTIKDVPPGNYKLTVWQEKLGTQSQPVTVSGDQTVAVNFVYHPKPNP
ncbi:MAG TPA: carboxypeptidase regulatory-like domain-containing protein [Candidatus Binataceae bacterium]|nr:carboxypeptidase regulatory-like domain-containing protein [Candidatus Binataceae bacterium]